MVTKGSGVGDTPFAFRSTPHPRGLAHKSSSAAQLLVADPALRPWPRPPTPLLGFRFNADPARTRPTRTPLPHRTGPRPL